MERIYCWLLVRVRGGCRGVVLERCRTVLLQMRRGGTLEEHRPFRSYLLHSFSASSYAR